MSPAEENVAFYFWIGQALTDWAHVESSLQRTVRACVADDAAARALAVAFFTLEGARARREFAQAMVERYLREYFDAATADAWNKLIDRAAQATRLRNKLAHYIPKFYEHSTPGRRYALEPAVFQKRDKRKNKHGKPIPKAGAICLREIVKMQLEFLCLSHALDNFLARVAGEKEPFQESDEQPSNPPPIHSLRRQILEALARLLRPSEKKPEVKKEVAPA